MPLIDPGLDATAEIFLARADPPSIDDEDVTILYCSLTPVRHLCLPTEPRRKVYACPRLPRKGISSVPRLPESLTSSSDLAAPYLYDVVSDVTFELGLRARSRLECLAVEEEGITSRRTVTCKFDFATSAYSSQNLADKVVLIRFFQSPCLLPAQPAHPKKLTLILNGVRLHQPAQNSDVSAHTSFAPIEFPASELLATKELVVSWEESGIPAVEDLTECSSCTVFGQRHSDPGLIAEIVQNFSLSRNGNNDEDHDESREEEWVTDEESQSDTDEEDHEERPNKKPNQDCVRPDGTDYSIHFCLATKRDVKAVIAAVDRVTPLTEGVFQVKQKLQDSQDISIQAELCSLKCPVSRKAIRAPVRGEKCRHLDCFDAENYIEMVMAQGPNALWMCPICNEPAAIDQLVRDDLMGDILESFSSDRVKIVNGQNDVVIVEEYGAGDASPAKRQKVCGDVMNVIVLD